MRSPRPGEQQGGPVLFSWLQWWPAGTLTGHSLWLLLELLQTHLFLDTCLSLYQVGGTHPGDGAPCASETSFYCLLTREGSW